MCVLPEGATTVFLRSGNVLENGGPEVSSAIVCGGASMGRGCPYFLCPILENGLFDHNNDELS